VLSPPVQSSSHIAAHDEVSTDDGVDVTFAVVTDTTRRHLWSVIVSVVTVPTPKRPQDSAAFGRLPDRPSVMSSFTSRERKQTVSTVRMNKGNQLGTSGACSS